MGRFVHVSLGPYVRLYSEDYFLRELAPLGITRRSFRKLMRALCVPTLIIGRVRLIDSLSLAIALRAVLGIGRKNFAVGRVSRKVLKNAERSIDPGDILTREPILLREISEAQKLDGDTPDGNLVREARLAILRIVSEGRKRRTQ